MTTRGLLAEPVMQAEVVNRLRPAPTLLALVAGWLRGAKDAALEIADAALMPECNRDEIAAKKREYRERRLLCSACGERMRHPSDDGLCGFCAAESAA